ncbi:scavenger receptor cysteine-rich domain-containing group B protein-like [Pelecanus crispus]|uniref:scavenger receptor cysteine-rich domain-containing group B protein-like n=1 Tax=Pelecanus crispus TaxID=36300 RepID=UPI003F5D137F
MGVWGFCLLPLHGNLAGFTGAGLLIYLACLCDPVSSQRAPLRLSDGPHRCAGRVEVFYENQWGTVCDDHWDLEDAGVVCRQLDCGTVLSAPGAGHFRAGSGPIWLDDVNCVGTEVALSYCRTKGWGRNNCHHGEDAGVVCSGSISHPTAIHTGAAELRLVKGPNPCSGRVEVLHNHQWGTVCDDDWSLLDASVVCQQLGCGTAISAYGAAHFGQGSGPIWLDNVQCSGTENALSECMARPWGLNNCDHGEDASVVCTGTTTNTPVHLRLENGPGRCTGRVEVLHHHQWGTVCDKGWSLAEAAVVCRQLGCGTAISAPGSAHFGQGSGRIWLQNVNCTGEEAALSECQSRLWESNSCDHREDAGVVCSADPHTDTSGQHPLRLANGSNSCLGRVEVFHDQKWGTVCDDTWDLHDATVVCRQLGCGMALSAPGSAHFGPGSDPIWMDGVHCTGMESALTDCELSSWGEHNCGHSEDAGVVCSGDTRPQGPGRVGRVEAAEGSGCKAVEWDRLSEDTSVGMGIRVFPVSIHRTSQSRGHYTVLLGAGRPARHGGNALWDPLDPVPVDEVRKTGWTLPRQATYKQDRGHRDII